MGTINKRLSKLEKENIHRNKKHFLLTEKYPGQPLEEAKMEAGITTENEHEF